MPSSRDATAAGRALGIDDDDLAKTVAYSGDRYRFGRVCGWAEVMVGLAFIALGGLGLVEGGARAAADGLGLVQSPPASPSSGSSGC